MNLAASPNNIGITVTKLVHALRSATSIDVRIAVLKRVAKQYGDVGYPGFLKLLITIAESENENANRLIADTLFHCLQREDVPSGVLSAWGCQASHMDVFTPGTFSRPPNRNLGPVEYLLVWSLQRTQRRKLNLTACAYALYHLLVLVNHNTQSAQLYIARLNQLLSSDIDGTFTANTKHHLGKIVNSWSRNDSPQRIVSHLVE